MPYLLVANCAFGKCYNIIVHRKALNIAEFTNILQKIFHFCLLFAKFCILLTSKTSAWHKILPTQICLNNFAIFRHTKGMIIVFLRAIILFAVLLFTMRLMGKRQIGEMEPFELVITLVISELACIPMADRSIPITFGIVAILTMFVIHQAILLLSKNKKMQTVINGKPVMVIDSHGIDVQALNSLNMTVGDILQSMRSAEYFSLEEITYGIMETNGQLTVIPNKNMTNRQQTLPIVVIEQGKWNDEEITQHNFDKASLQLLLRQERINVKNVVILAIDENNRMTLQTKHRPISFKNVEVKRL